MLRNVGLIPQQRAFVMVGFPAEGISVKDSVRRPTPILGIPLQVHFFYHAGKFRAACEQFLAQLFFPGCGRSQDCLHEEKGGTQEHVDDTQGRLLPDCGVCAGL